MSDERKLAVEDREKIQRLLESGTLENVTLALSLIEETANTDDIARFFTKEVILDLICLADPVLHAFSIMRKCPNTLLVFVESLANPRIMTMRDYRMRNIKLSEFTTFSSAVLTELANAQGTLHLNGLTSLSNPVAESLSKHSGCLYLNGLTELSDAAESLSKHEGDLYLNSIKRLSDATAESLSKHGGDLYLNGLTELSDAAAQSLSTIKGFLFCNRLTRLSDSPGDVALADTLGKCSGTLDLIGLTELSGAAAESLSKHEGDLYLNSIKRLSDATAESLSKHGGDLYLNGLTDISFPAAIRLALHNNLHISTEIKLQIKKAVSARNKQARESAKTRQTALTKKQAVKLRTLFRSKDADNVLIAVELIDASEATQDDISDVLSSSVLSLLVNTWDVRVWNALAPLLLSYPNAKREFTELAEKRLHQQFESSYKQVNEAEGFLNDFYKDLTKPTALLELKFLDIIPGSLYLDLTELSDVAADSFSGQKGRLHLDGLTELSDAAAESLSKHEGGLCLNGLTSLSDAAAESLSKHEGEMDLDGLTELSDAAAESLSKHGDHDGNTRRADLSLNGLTSLSDAAAESLSKHEGFLDLGGLTSLSDVAAEILSKHEGGLRLNGLSSLSDATAESLSKYRGDLYLGVLTSLSDTAAQSLTKKEPKFRSWEIKLYNLPASAAKILRDAGHGE
jgi:hypothetical protein